MAGCTPVSLVIGGLLIHWIARPTSGNGVYGEWAAWSDCSNLRCSTRTRRRSCHEESSGSTPACDEKLTIETNPCNQNFCFGDDITIVTAVLAGIVLLLVLIIVVLCIRRRRARKVPRRKKTLAKRPKPSQNPAEYVENLYDETASRARVFVALPPNKLHGNDGFDDSSSAGPSMNGSAASFSISKNSSNIYLPGIDDAASDVPIPEVKFNPLYESGRPVDYDDLDLDSLGSESDRCIVEKTVSFGPEKVLVQYFDESDAVAPPPVMKVLTSCETQTDNTDGIIV